MASSRQAALLCCLVLCGALSAPTALAQTAAVQPDYRDDRSTPQAVVESFYNAVARKEYLRAWSYLREGEEQPPFESFAKGYETTAAVRVRTGEAVSEGAAGSIYHSLPVAVEATKIDGSREVFTGCYELRLAQPAVQAEPPFVPMGIVKGKLEKSEKPFEEAMGTCPAAGLE